MEKTNLEIKSIYEEPVKVKLEINGMVVECSSQLTVLEAATLNKIRIPNLCSIKNQTIPSASCRLCLVEVEGISRLQTSCTLKVKEGMKIKTHSPKVQAVRKNIVELLLADHPEDCLLCPKSSNGCELSKLAQEVGITERKYSPIKKDVTIDISSPALVRDQKKCILCGRCVYVCNKQQKIAAIDFVHRGFKTKIVPGLNPGLNVSNCIYCGQCIKVCPTGALTEKSHIEQVISALKDPSTFAVVQMAPAIPASLSKELGTNNYEKSRELIATALRRIGFQAVFDTSFTADLTVMEEATELINRIKNNGPLPMFTSCSPGWVRYVEIHKPELIPHLSTCKSPQQMMSAIIKEFYAKRIDLSKKKLYNVSIMPCTAKKFEAADNGDTNAVLTAREVVQLFNRFGISLNDITERTKLDEPLATATGAGKIFAKSGGVMEAALRTAHFFLTGKDMDLTDSSVSSTSGSNVESVFNPIPTSLPISTQSQGMSKAAGSENTNLNNSESGLKSFATSKEHVRFFTQNFGNLKVNGVVVNGIGELKAILKDIMDGSPKIHFVEVMTCPGGCISGGGVPTNLSSNEMTKISKEITEADQKAEVRLSHRNEAILSLYKEFLGEPNSKKAHQLLHRSYHRGH